jgi:lysophospholipase L1-like esterase
MQQKTYIPSDEKKIVIHGRTSLHAPNVLFWTGSSVELRTDASCLSFEIETEFSVFEQWIRIVVNNYTMIRMPLNRGMNTVSVFRGMTPDKIKHVTLIKEVQPMRDDPNSFLKICAIHCDGELYPVEKKHYRIEFIGDSITSGEGLAGTTETISWVPMIFTTQEHYALKTAHALHADYRILSQSGWGVYTGWDNDPNKALPKYYTKVCSVLSDEHNKSLGSCEDYQFSSWVPDAIVVNLGCNDSFAFNSPPWKDPVSGAIYQQGIKSTDQFCSAVYDFICLLRKCNPSSHIIWCYGMIGRVLQPYIEDTVSSYIRDTNDTKVSFQLLPDLKEEWIAANNHPGEQSHEAAANVLIDTIGRILESNL